MSFPVNPVDQEKYNDYVYDDSNGLWKYQDYNKIPEGATFHLPSYSFAHANSDYVMVSPNGKKSGRFNKQTFSISTWVYMSTIENYGIIWSYDYISHDPPHYAQQFRINAGGSLLFDMNSGGSLSTSTGVVQAGQWNHILVRRQPGTAQLLVNGVQQTSSTVATNISYYAQEVWIGRGNWDYTADMSILDLRFYDRYLSDGEVNTLGLEFNKDKYFTKE